jgi:thiol-disulfide isomerase/thioredoxin
MIKPLRFAPTMSAIALATVIAGCATPQSNVRTASGGKDGSPQVGLAMRALGALEANEVLTHEQLAGQVALIDFWATWCGPCVASLPGLAQLHRELGPRGLRLVSVNTEPENRESVRAFVKKHELPFPVYVDTGVAQYRFRVSTLPTVMLVDRRGRIRHVHVGATASNTLGGGRR